MTNGVTERKTSLAERIIPGATGLMAVLGIAYACVLIGTRSLLSFQFHERIIKKYPVDLVAESPVDSGITPFLIIFGIFLLLLLIQTRFKKQIWDRNLLVVTLLCLASIIAILLLPLKYQIDFTIHRWFISMILLLCISIPALCTSIYHFMGTTPRAFDISRYPLLLFPIVIALVAYGIIIVTILARGIPPFNWEVILTASSYGGGTATLGLLNDILGTFLLMALTTIIALPIGIGTGIYISEYGGWLAKIMGLSTTILRAMSVVILGLGAYAVARMSYYWELPDGSHPLQGIFSGTSIIGKGTYLLAAIFLSMLIIPVIARATEEGFRSLPRDLREGSLAVGATEGYTLFNILLPWSLPNILTGVLLGCAEVAGSVAVIILIAGAGNYGVGPFSEVTSLSHFIYRIYFYSPMSAESRVLGDYRYTAAMLLLIITLGLTIVYLILRHRFAERYRGGTGI
jgi:phosphate transport system permease protein